MQRPPAVGMRIVKSACAVFLCFVIDWLRGGGTPFYSAIAAVLCMQPYVSHSVRTALNRTIGTVIGAVAGLLVLLAERMLLPSGQPIRQYLLVSACIVPLIYITVLLKKTSASYITCVVFLSITVAHGADVEPWLFALNRMIDTLIGIFVSLAVNAVRLPRRRNRRLLLIADLDVALGGENGAVDSRAAVRLGRLLAEGAKATFATSLTPEAALHLLDGVELRLPFIAFDGAVVYDPVKKSIVFHIPIPREQCIAAAELARAHGARCFLLGVAHGLLHVCLENGGDAAHWHAHSREFTAQSCICGPLPEAAQVCALVAEVSAAQADALSDQLQAAGLMVSRRALHGEEGVLLTAAAATRLESAQSLLPRVGADRIAVCGGTPGDEGLLRAADIAYASAAAPETVRREADGGVVSGAVAAVRALEKSFHARRRGPDISKTA